MKGVLMFAAATAILALGDPGVADPARLLAAQAGLYGEFFDNFDFGTPPSPGSRLDATVNFNWGSTGSPGPDSLPPGISTNDSWSARWSGLLTAPSTGSYLFQTTSDDGVRLWVGNTLVIDRWRDQTAAIWTGTINLVAGTSYSLRLDYYQNTSLAQVRLAWTPPGAGTIVTVPQAQLLAQVDAPTILPAAGSYSDSVIVTLADNSAGAEIRYTTDGSPPSIASTLYTGPFVLSTTKTVNAQAFRSGTLLADSAVSSSVFTIVDSRPPRVTSILPLSGAEVLVTFSEPVDPATAQTAGNYSITIGATIIAISSATLVQDLRSVLLATAALAPGTTYTLTVKNVTDLALPTPNVIRPNFQKVFTFVGIPGGGSLTGVWRFDEGTGTTAADSQGGNTGTLTNGPAWLVDGPIVGALRFDGVNDYVALASNLQPALGGTATLAARVRTTGAGNLPVRAPGIAGAVTVGTGFTTNTNDLFWGWLDETGRIGIVAGQTNDASVSPAPSPPNPQPGARSAAPVNDGQWHHVALTRDSTSGVVQVYIDGLLSASGSSELGVKTTAFQSLGRIEGSVGTSQHPLSFPGDLDDVRIYTSILSASEIQTLVNRAPQVAAGPTQALSPGVFSTNLTGSVADDGFPITGTLTSTWSVVSGPGTVAFGTPNASATTATFSTTGVYLLRLSATDGQLTSSDDVLVCVGWGVTITPNQGLATSESGTTASFTVVLDAAPTADVTIAMASSDPAEGLISSVGSPVPSAALSLTFTSLNWDIPQTVTITGVPDGVYDGDKAYTIAVSPAASLDPCYSGIEPGDVSVVNFNIDPPPPPPKVWSRCSASVAGNGLLPGSLLLAAAFAILLVRRRA